MKGIDCYPKLCSFCRRADYSKEKVQPALELTLKNLHLDYLDLYLVHAPFSYTDSQQMKYIGYDAARIGQVWEVSIHYQSHYTDHYTSTLILLNTTNTSS